MPLTLPKAGDRSEFLDRGIFQFFPRVSTGLTYDDNILLSEDGKEGDLIGFVAPGLTIIVGDTAGTLSGGVPVSAAGFTSAYGSISSLGRGLSMSSIGLSLDYTARCDFYRENSELNSVDHVGRANFVLPLSRGQLTLEQQVQSSAEVPIDLSARIRQTTYSTRLALNQEISSLTSFNSSLNYGLSQVDQGIGNQQLSGNLFINYAWSDLTAFGLGGTLGALNPENAETQTFEQMLASVSYRVTELVSLSGSAGVEWRQYEAGGSADPTPVFTLFADYAATERTRVGLRGSRSVTSSAVLADQNYANTSVGLYLSQFATPRLNWSFSLNYNRLNYNEAGSSVSTDTSRDDSYYSADMRVNYLLAWRVALSMFYEYRINSSSAGAGYSNNHVGFSLDWAY